VYYLDMNKTLKRNKFRELSAEENLALA